MKKKITLFVVSMMALPVLAACGSKGYVETRTEEEIVNQLGAQALSEVGVNLSKFAGEGVSYGETALVTTVNEKVWEKDEVGMNFSLVYELTAQETYAVEYLKLQDGKLIADIITSQEAAAYEKAAAMEGAVYTLKAKISFAGYGENFVAPKGLTVTDTFKGKELATKSYNTLVKVTKSGTIAEIKEAKKDDMVLFTGRVSAWFDYTKDQLYSGCFLTDGEDGVQLYAGKITDYFFDADGNKLINEGEIIQVFGQVSPYNGLFEVKPQKITVVTDPVETAKIAPTSLKTMTVPEVKAAETKDTGNLIKVSGLKVKAYDKNGSTDPSVLSVGSHWSITVQDSEGNEVLLYVNYHIGSAAQTAIKNTLSGMSASDVFAFRGALSSYNAPQLSPVNTADFSAEEAISVAL